MKPVWIEEEEDEKEVAVGKWVVAPPVGFHATAKKRKKRKKKKKKELRERKRESHKYI